MLSCTLKADAALAVKTCGLLSLVNIDGASASSHETSHFLHMHPCEMLAQASAAKACCTITRRLNAFVRQIVTVSSH
jgi:hypothetical protein